MEWYEQEDEDVQLLVAGQQEIRECIYPVQVVIHSMVLEATTLPCGQAGMEMATAKEEEDKRYGSSVNFPNSSNSYSEARSSIPKENKI